MIESYPMFVDVALKHPIGDDDGDMISSVRVRFLSSRERKEIRRSRSTMQRRGIATMQAATGLSWAEVREIEPVDAEAIGQALIEIDQQFLALGDTLAKA